MAITANTIYVASYHTNVGHYAGDRITLAPPGWKRAFARAAQNGISGFNGVYAYGAASNFPNQGFQSTNYWVDVVFKSGP